MQSLSEITPKIKAGRENNLSCSILLSYLQIPYALGIGRFISKQDILLVNKKTLF